jgi:hypothetical protein
MTTLFVLDVPENKPVAEVAGDDPPITVDRVFDCAAAETVLRSLIDDWRRKRWCAIEFVHDSAAECAPFRRLPCERLFLGP